MTSLITQPQLLASAAADASSIGSALDQARSAAAASTTNVVAAAEDEISSVTAQLFGAYGQEYQALLQQATTFHEGFVAALSAAGSAYTQAEAEIASSLGLTGAATTNPVFAAVTQAKDPTVDAILIMTGSDTGRRPRPT